MTEQAEELTLRVDDGVAVVTMDRPATRNAITVAMKQAMERCLARVEQDPAIRVAVLASSSAHFCVGADLGEIANGDGPKLTAGDNGFFGFVKARRLKPWIAAVTGYAVGGGFEVALACDMMVAGEDATFAMPEAQLGMLAGAGGAFRLAQRIPQAIALEVLLGGRRLKGGEAGRLGLANAVVPDGEVPEAALALARRIASAAPIPTEETLRLVREASQLPERELWALSAAATRRIMASEDVKEGTRAFREKRPPRWSGA